MNRNIEDYLHKFCIDGDLISLQSLIHEIYHRNIKIENHEGRHDIAQRISRSAMLGIDAAASMPSIAAASMPSIDAAAMPREVPPFPRDLIFKHAVILLAFREACMHNHLRVAQWITMQFALNVDDVRFINNLALRNTCQFGQLETAQWITDYFGLTSADARAENNYALRQSCRNGHLETAQWLIDEFKLTPEDCLSEHVDILSFTGLGPKSAAKLC
jgi:hypothetical protein